MTDGSSCVMPLDPAMQVVKEVADRLLDFEDKVRSAAATAVCSAAMSCPQVYSQ